MSESRTNKTVSFTTKDKDDVRRLEHAEQINPLSNKKQNFSKYVKQLIDEDIERKGGNSNNKSVNAKPHERSSEFISVLESPATLE